MEKELENKLDEIMRMVANGFEDTKNELKSDFKNELKSLESELKN